MCTWMDIIHTSTRSLPIKVHVVSSSTCANMYHTLSLPQNRLGMRLVHQVIDSQGLIIMLTMCNTLQYTRHTHRQARWSGVDPLLSVHPAEHPCTSMRYFTTARWPYLKIVAKKQHILIITSVTLCINVQVDHSHCACVLHAHNIGDTTHIIHPFMHTGEVLYQRIHIYPFNQSLLIWLHNSIHTNHMTRPAIIELTTWMCTWFHAHIHIKYIILEGTVTCTNLVFMIIVDDYPLMFINTTLNRKTTLASSQPLSHFFLRLHAFVEKIGEPRDDRA